MFSEGAEKENPSMIADSFTKLVEKSPVDILIASLLEDKPKSPSTAESLNTTLDSFSEDAPEVEKPAVVLADPKARKAFLAQIIQITIKMRNIPIKRSMSRELRKVASTLIQGKH